MASTAPTPEITSVLVANHRRFLSFLSRRVPTPEMAEDILQEAFVRGMTKAPALTSSESIVAWFYRVLRNAIVDHYRRAGVEERAMGRLASESADSVAPVDAELFDEVCGCVRSLVSTLKPEYAAAVTRVDIDGLPLAAFAQETGISANNAGVRLHRAHKALKARLQETCGTCADHGCYQCSCGRPAAASSPSACH